MDRRQFFSISGLPWACGVFRPSSAGEASLISRSQFKTIDFVSDGLGLDPAEYATLLSQRLSSMPLQSDSYSSGGLVTALEQQFAQLLGKESAIFLPTGTLANHLAVRALAGADRRVLVQLESHLYNDSGDCAEVLSGLNLIPLAPGKSTLELEEIKQWVERSNGGRVKTAVGVISIESPVRRRHHEMFAIRELERICAYARERGIRLHLDGARMFNLPYHSGKSVKEYAALFDTVYVSTWKHFNGTYGAILAGDRRLIGGLADTRRMFGGSLPHAWPGLALVGQYASHYEAEYARAWKVADELIARLEMNSAFKVRKMSNGTSLFFLSVDGVTPAQFADRLLKRGVRISAVSSADSAIPLQVNATITRTTAARLAQWFTESISG